MKFGKSRSAPHPKPNRLEQFLVRGALVIALLAGLATGLSGTGFGLEEQMRIARDSLRSRAASGQVHIVEIDAFSLSKYNDWPWPRQLHGRLVDQLGRDGAQMVAFDVDFSARSNPASDMAFANALERFGGSVVLPTFKQKSRSNSAVFSENLPIEPLRAHSFLASVNVTPDPDGQMRHYNHGTVTSGAPRPSIGAMLAGTSGQIGTEFRIDTSIRPDTIPRHSFADIVEGRVPVSALRGKSFLVGATAIEMGDRYAVPGHGVLPGVVVQAMAAETLIQASSNPSLGWWPALLIICGSALVALRIRNGASNSLLAGISLVALLGMPLLLETMRWGSLEIVPALAALFWLTVLNMAIAAIAKLRVARMEDAQTGLPNARALEQSALPFPNIAVVAVELKQFEEITAVLNPDERTDLMKRVVDRLGVGIGAAKLHILKPGTLGFFIPDGEVQTIIEEVEGMSALFRAPIELGRRSILITPAFGLTFGAGKTTGELVLQAGNAAVRAADADQRWALHSADVASETDRALLLLADIDHAIAHGEILVAYQPKWDVRAKSIKSAEALVRWNHPALGPIPPDEFIPVLEKHNRLDDLTLHVLDRCMADLRQWQAGNMKLAVAINISAPLLADTDFMAAVEGRLMSTDNIAALLTFEITESATVSNTQTAICALEKFRSWGARVSIDDYGTGQSSLTYLKSFPADEIKIDKSFVSAMKQNKGDQILVRSTIDLAHELGFKVVAEGVEDADCLALLERFGCDTAQGWLIGKPMPAAALIDLIQSSYAPEKAKLRKAG